MHTNTMSLPLLIFRKLSLTNRFIYCFYYFGLPLKKKFLALHSFIHSLIVFPFKNEIFIPKIPKCQTFSLSFLSHLIFFLNKKESYIRFNIYMIGTLSHFWVFFLCAVKKLKSFIALLWKMSMSSVYH